MASGGDERLLGLLTEAIASRAPVVMATVVSTKRSVPRRSGTKMLVYQDGTQEGTVGGGAMETRVVSAAGDSMRTGKTQLLTFSLLEPERGDPGVCGGTVDIYLEPYMPAHTVFVIGAGHIGRAVVDLASWLGYQTVITDDRKDRVSEEAMPDADVRHHGTVAEALAAHKVTENTSVVVVSRDYAIDVDAVPQLLATSARYLGVMGSERRWQTVRKELLAAGVDETSLDRIHNPVGIELNAETVEEIAVSILSEVIQVTRGSMAEQPDDD
jgi:xanthine dehydrogenase accessory factor